MTTLVDAASTTSHAKIAARKPWQSAEWRTAVVISAVRLVIGFLFLCHGLQGTFGAFGGVDGHGAAMPAGSFGWYTSVLEALVGALVGAGLCTRTVATFGSGMMAFAYFTVHQPTGALPIENLGEPAAMYSWIFLLIAVLGPGKYAVDTVRGRRGA